MPIRLFLFGTPRLAQGDGRVALAFERRTQLLAHLALRRGGATRTELAAMLWPAASMEQAHINLRKTLMRLRSLPWAPAIVMRDHTLEFDGTSDVADFESAIAERRWMDALQIADAPLLAGYDDDASEAWTEWLRTERVRLRNAWRLAAGECMASATDPAQVLALAARLLADDPLDESALRAQMLAYVQQGRPGQARTAYRIHAAQLADEMGVQPSPELQALHDSLGPAGGDRLQAPPVPREQRLVGRVAEQRALRARLEDGCPLLSLIGPGGVGKSCLARNLMSELAPRYADGVAFVPLEDVESPDALGARLARELSVQSGGGEPLQTVITFLRGRRMLLVLDNFEHQRAAAPQVQALLDACPGVQVLITSRVRLGLPAEHLLPLDGLACPEAEDVDCLETFDAARLFVRAAQAVEPALQPAAEAKAIAEICRLVDGLPLALEIAAVWTRVLPCEAIAAELRNSIALLTENDSARPARHASMAAVFEHSWQRLSPIERTTWARLTVFHGGFTMEAARAVTGATLPVLAALTDQSLLRKTGSRADLHPLLRQLASGRLTIEEREAASRAHAAYYLHSLAPLRAGLVSGDKQVIQQIDVDFENARAAWHWACAHGPADALQAAVLTLMTFCESRMRHPEGLALRRAAAGIAAEHPRLGPLLDAAAAHTEYRLGHCADAQALARRALLASRATRDHDTRLLCFKVLGGCSMELGHLRHASRRYRQALAQARANTDWRSAASMLQNLALLDHRTGRYDAARNLYMQALVEHRRVHDVNTEALCLSNLAWLEMETGQIDAAAAHLEASLALCERHGLTNTKMMALENLTELSVRRNDAAAAQRHGRRAYELASQAGARAVQLQLQLLFAQLAVQQCDAAAAQEALQAAVEMAIALDNVPRQLDCVLSFADLLSLQGEWGAAIRLARYAIEHPAAACSTRERARGRLTEWAASRSEAAALRAPAIDLWTLVHRIAGETQLVHAPLIESLQVP